MAKKGFFEKRRAAKEAKAEQERQKNLREDFKWATLRLSPFTKLNEAIRLDLPEEVTALLEAGNKPTTDWLNLVVQKKLPVYVEMFIKAGATPTVEMLDVATRNSDVKTVNLILNAGVLPDEKALASAVKLKWSGAVAEYIKRGAEPTVEMLETATLNKDVATVNLLLNAGVVPDEKALDAAVQVKWSNAVEDYIKRDAKPTMEMLEVATLNNDVTTVNLLLGAGLVPDEKALAAAVKMKWSNAVITYIKRGANPSASMVETATANRDTTTANILQVALAILERCKPAPANDIPAPRKKRPRLEY